MVTKYRVKAYEWMAKIELGNFGNKDTVGILLMRWLKTKGTEGTQGDCRIWDGPKDGEL